MPERISGPSFTIFPDGSQTNNSPLAALFTVRGGGGEFNKIRGNIKGDGQECPFYTGWPQGLKPSASLRASLRLTHDVHFVDVMLGSGCRRIRTAALWVVERCY